MDPQGMDRTPPLATGSSRLQSFLGVLLWSFRSAVRLLSVVLPPDGAKLERSGPRGNSLDILTAGQVFLLGSLCPACS